jgi:predicted lipoprotein
MLVMAPSIDTLRACRARWREARVPLKQAQAFGKGPFLDLGVRSALDWYPGDSTAVERALTTATMLTPDGVDLLGANQRGMPAIEFVLFSRSLGDEAVLETLTRGTDAPQRRAFLEAVSTHGARKASAFANAWASGPGGYASQFSSAGRGSTTFTTTRAAIDLLVNELIGATDSAAGMRLGVPLGVRAAGVPQPDRVESPWSDASIDDLRALIEGVRAIYLGSLDARRAMGLGALVRSRNTATDDVALARIDAALSAITAIRGPLRVAVVEDRVRVQAALDATRALKTTLQVDVANLLGVTVTFTDNDGD